MKISVFLLSIFFINQSCVILNLLANIVMVDMTNLYWQTMAVVSDDAILIPGVDAEANIN
jgi:hypothetical protein